MDIIDANTKYKRWGWGAVIALVGVILIAGLVVAVSMSSPKPNSGDNVATTSVETEDGENGGSNSNENGGDAQSGSEAQSEAQKKAEEEAAAKKKAEEEEAARKEEEEAAKKNSVPAISMDGIETISASSWKSEPEDGLYHVPENMIDGNLSTGWCEDAGGDGIGETVYLYFDKQYKVTGMYIYPGYHKSQDLFEKNGVPVKIKITGDHAETFTLNDEMKSQKITFSEPMLTEKLTIEILKVRSGSKYKDTLITDILMY